MTHHSPESAPLPTPEAEPIPMAHMPEIGQLRDPHEEARLAGEFHTHIQTLGTSTGEGQRLNANQQEMLDRFKRLYGEGTDQYNQIAEVYGLRANDISSQQQSAIDSLGTMFKENPDIAPAWVHPVLAANNRNVVHARGLDSDPKATYGVARTEKTLYKTRFGKPAAPGETDRKPEDDGRHEAERKLRALRNAHVAKPVRDAGPAPQESHYDLTTRKGKALFESDKKLHAAALTRAENERKARALKEREHETTLAKTRLAERSALALHNRATQGLDMQNALKGSFGKVAEVAERVLEERRQTIEQANIALTEVHSHINLWNMGDAAPDAEHAAQAGELLNQIAEQIDNLAPTDPERHALMAQWVKQTARLQGRQILATGDTSDPSAPSFTPDRGIRMQTDNGEQVFYDDGTIGFTDFAGNIHRTTTSGQAYTPNPFPVAPELLPELDSIPLVHDTETDIADMYDTAFAEWEQTRLPDKEQIAEHIAEHYADRLAERDEQYMAAITSIAHDVEAHQARLENMESGRNTAIAIQLDQNEKLGSPRTEAEIIAAIDARIEAQRTATEAAREESDLMIAELKKHRALMNKVRYEQGFLSSSSELRGESSDVIILQNGAVAFNETVMNGIRGNWNVLPDGKSMLTEPDGTTRIFNEFGEEL